MVGQKKNGASIKNKMLTLLVALAGDVTYPTVPSTQEQDRHGLWNRLLLLGCAGEIKPTVSACQESSKTSFVATEGSLYIKLFTTAANEEKNTHTQLSLHKENRL